MLIKLFIISIAVSISIGISICTYAETIWAEVWTWICCHVQTLGLNKRSLGSL